MIIAIDGPAGSGKSTVARQVAADLNFLYLDTGAMYRCITWLALERGIDLRDEAAIGALARAENIVFHQNCGDGEQSRVEIAGTDVSSAIRSARIDACVSTVAALPALRDALVKQQQSYATQNDVVMEGRDIGTVVFPNAELKIFLTADASCRAIRRALQNQERGYGSKDQASLLEEIKRRDRIDSSRACAPLKPASDAIVLDTTRLSIEQVCEKIVELAYEVRKQ